MTSSTEYVVVDDAGGSDNADDDGNDEDGADNNDVERLSRQKKTQGFRDKCATACPCFMITICAHV